MMKCDYIFASQPFYKMTSDQRSSKSGPGIFHSCRLKPKNCFLMATGLVLGGQKQEFNLGATLMPRGRVDLGGSLYKLVHCKAVLRLLHFCKVFQCKVSMQLNISLQSILEIAHMQVSSMQASMFARQCLFDNLPLADSATLPPKILVGWLHRQQQQE